MIHDGAKSITNHMLGPYKSKYTMVKGIYKIK